MGSEYHYFIAEVLGIVAPFDQFKSTESNDVGKWWFNLNQ